MMILREAPGWAVYFAAYETLKPFFRKFLNETVWLYIVAGGLSGTISWVFGYPQDVIKNRLQLDTEKKYRRHSLINDGGIINCTKDIWRQQGLLGFWKGFGITAVRGFIANAATFLAYEEVKKVLMGTPAVMA